MRGPLVEGNKLPGRILPANADQAALPRHVDALDPPRDVEAVPLAALHRKGLFEPAVESGPQVMLDDEALATVHHRPTGRSPAENRAGFDPLVAEAAQQRADLVVLGETLSSANTTLRPDEAAAPTSETAGAAASR